MVIQKQYYNHGWMILFLLVLGSNAMLYHTAVGKIILPENTSAVVIGSLIDLAIVLPFLFLAWIKKWSWKYMIVSIASGLILIRFLVPMDYLKPFISFTWGGFFVFGIILLVEVCVLLTLIRFLPTIIRTTKHEREPILFAFSKAVERTVKDTSIIRMISSELLMLYYALASWRTKPKSDEKSFTIHKNSSFIALQVMLIHAVIIEMIGLHWWFHKMSPSISLILLLMNIYTVLYFVAEIQAVRLNPLKISKNNMFISFGLKKRMNIQLDNIDSIVIERSELEKERTRETIEFIAKDLEEVLPTVILTLKRPTAATLYMGIKKHYRKVAIRVDEERRFLEFLQNEMKKREVK
ncbi:beta-carotene 15,15'-monooxygenase [Ornithinibacillus xuwenensis]|uniref:Beta-carotene 15,15'-monooxygenase n=1 Tax=Ornithinibacillus xuwenensis TaxID=3144668 RepID=A0ABU9XIX5_9BACI